MNNYICHHGVKGQKWGVRRFQNRDGSLTSDGRARQRLANTHRYVKKSSKDVQSIVDTLSSREKKLLGADDGAYMKPEQVEHVAKRFIKRVRGVPVAFLDVYYEDMYDTNVGEISIATRSDNQYRHKGYASELVDKAQAWFSEPETQKYLGMKALAWTSYLENEKSISLGQAKGFVKDSVKSDDTWWTGLYKRK